MSSPTLVAPNESAETMYWDDDNELCEDPPPLLDRLSGTYDHAQSETEDAFALLADDLEAAMLVAGSTRRLAQHPAYTEVLAMGDKAIPLLLARLAYPGARPLWLRLLGSLTAYEPGAGKRTVHEAAAAWVKWGKLRGFTGAI